MNNLVTTFETELSELARKGKLDKKHLAEIANEIFANSGEKITVSSFRKKEGIALLKCEEADSEFSSYAAVDLKNHKLYEHPGVSPESWGLWRTLENIAVKIRNSNRRLGEKFGEYLHT